MKFIDALDSLWPSGDSRIAGLRVGMAAALPALWTKYELTPLVLAHIMAQISHECGAGTEVVENLNYSAGRLMQVWPLRFMTFEAATPYAHNPQALANKVYGGRMGNKPGTSDGWDFRGRGATQTTGRNSYASLAANTGLDLVKQPDLVNDPAHFLDCGIADFMICGCMPAAEADNIRGVTRHLNGGLIGLEQRQVWLARWKAANIQSAA
jgi:putative chitinase